MWSLADTLDRLAPWLREPLADAPALSRLREVAGRLPAALTRYVYLECWLREGPARVDLIVKLEAPGLEMLAECSPRAFGAELAAEPVWRRAAAFARAWRDGLRRDVECLWLEFDLEPAAASQAVRQPRFFVDFRTHAYRHPSLAERLRLARSALEPLGGGGAAEDPTDRLAACLAGLPVGATIPYLGLVYRHPTPVVRLCALGLGSGLARYLDAVRWEGDAADLTRRVVAPLARAKGSTVAESLSVLHLDLAPRVERRVGLEFAFGRAGQSRGHLRDRPLLDQLVASGWCAAESRDALAGWPGSFLTLFAHEVWQGRARRRLAHVKVTYATGEPIEAKAYLCFSYDLLAGPTLVGSPPSFVGPPLS